MYFYNAFGLSISSTFLLPELADSAENRADVTIRLGKVHLSLPTAGTSEKYFHQTELGAYFYWKQVGAFCVRGSTEIIVDPLPDVEEQLLRQPLLGPVLATLLHLRGLLVLHASAVAVNESAVVFLGRKGWGKSTMAASLYMRGHSLLSDDIVALDVAGAAEPMLLPGFPQLKLWPDAVSALGDNPEELPRLWSQIEKRSRLVRCGFEHNPAPLKCIYVLDKGPAAKIEPLEPRQAMLQLLCHTYAALFGQQLLQSGSATHFRQCADLVKKVPFCRLKRPQSHELLSTTAQLVEKHGQA